MKLGWLFDKKNAGENIVEAIHAVSGKNIFAKRFEKKYLIPLQRQFKINKNITTAHQFDGSRAKIIK
jgi:hypothetical protein